MGRKRKMNVECKIRRSVKHVAHRVLVSWEKSFGNRKLPNLCSNEKTVGGKGRLPTIISLGIDILSN